MRLSPQQRIILEWLATQDRGEVARARCRPYTTRSLKALARRRLVDVIDYGGASPCRFSINREGRSALVKQLPNDSTEK